MFFICTNYIVCFDGGVFSALDFHPVNLGSIPDLNTILALNACVIGGPVF